MKMPGEITQLCRGEIKSTLLPGLAIPGTKLCGNKDGNTFVLINAVGLTGKNIFKAPPVAPEALLQLEISAMRH